MPDIVAPCESVPESVWLTRTRCELFRRPQIVHLDRPMPWLWHGYVAKHHLTLLTGQWKVGKSTMLAGLLARLSAGGMYAGQSVAPGRAVVVTEEGACPWLKRIVRHEIGDGVSFAFSPFLRRPSPDQWTNLFTDIADLHRVWPIDLLVIDPITAVLPGQEESSAAAMTSALRPVRELAIAGPGVLLVHHPRKGRSQDGQAARGTGALPALVDFQLELHWAGRANVENRRRQLLAWSRNDETPRRALLELSSDGIDYIVVPEGAEPLDDIGQRLIALIRDRPASTTRELWDWWSPVEARPRLRALTERLQDLVAARRLTRTGAGHRYEPYRYELIDTGKAVC